MGTHGVGAGMYEMEEVRTVTHIYIYIFMFDDALDEDCGQGASS